MKPSDKNCGNCYYHDGINCRRNAPTTLITSHENDSMSTQSLFRPTAWWPETGLHEWCGDWKEDY